MYKSKILIFLFFSIFVSCQTEQKAVSKYPADVGDIEFDEKLDDLNFKICPNDKFTFQYYNTGNAMEYSGEKIEIERKLESLNIKNNEQQNGYITIRFLVNCEGNTGKFRVQQLDENYKKILFDEKFTNQILKFTKNLNGWVIKEYEGSKVNYYQYLTYKIEDGKISEILP